jgi:hypothetical protein
MSLDGQPSPHGVGMHPTPAGPAYLAIKLDGKHRRFKARVGQNEGPQPLRDPMRFTLVADGKAIWHSRPNYGGKDVEDVDQPIEGVKELRLELSCEGEPRGAHGLWFEPRLE